MRGVMIQSVKRTKLVIAAALSLAAFCALAQEFPKGAVVVTPDELVWKPSPRVAGVEVADIVGDSTKPGPYVQRVKLPPNYRIPPHTHPEDRTYTIISGMWYVGFGDKFDEAKLIALPPGSYYTEPANTPHFVMTKGEGVVFHLTGNGPSGIKMIEAPAAR
jgi:quercetin dioxygenase-like cupin family protein